MNAKEFAHELEKAASFIRQQQAELDRAVELYTDKAIENEALKKEPVELTDEEIDNISDEIPHYIDTYMGRRMFARAILIKAQEK